MKEKYSKVTDENSKLVEDNNKLKGERQEAVRKLFKIDADDDMIHLNPYEIHQKMRTYEARYDSMQDALQLNVYFNSKTRTPPESCSLQLNLPVNKNLEYQKKIMKMADTLLPYGTVLTMYLVLWLVILEVVDVKGDLILAVCYLVVFLA